MLVTVSDKKIQHTANNTTVDYYTTDVVTANDYTPFGSLMSGRNYNAPGKKDYQFGFNGKENDNDVKGVEGGQQDYGMRIYDPRLGRFLSVDPLQTDYPELTPYQFASNSPVANVDLDGLESYYYLPLFNKDGKVVKLVFFKELPTSEGGGNHCEKRICYQLKTWSGVYSQKFETLAALENYAIGKTEKELNDFGDGGQSLFYIEQAAQIASGLQGSLESAEGSAKADASSSSAANYSADETGIITNPNAFKASSTSPTSKTNQKVAVIHGGTNVAGKKTNGMDLPAYRKTSDFRPVVLANWKKLGGRTLIIDEQLSPGLEKNLKLQGYVTKIFAKGTLDNDIIKYAKANNAIVLTNNIKHFKNQGITTIGVTNIMRESKNTQMITNALNNLNVKARSSPDVLKSGSHVPLGTYKTSQ